ncbi:MAG: hypothetical protein K2O63_03505 [Alistipes sp.]|nr:hypothetical protein [Alistipes sp.]
MKKVSAALAALLLAGGTAAHCAEPPHLSARLEPDSIAIGDRFDLLLEVDRDVMQAVEFPSFTPPAESGLEIVAVHPADTLVRDGRRMTLRKRYTMAAFEEGEFHLGRAEALYLDKNVIDTLRSAETLQLTVGTFAIDSTSHSIYDIKPQRTLPFRFGEIGGYLAWGLLALAALAGAVLAARRLLARRGGIARLFRPAPPVPPHLEAIRALEALRHRKLWQSGQHKAYYSGLTDILRTYLAARYGFGAMEMTSDEIIAETGRLDLPLKNRADLTAVLRQADLVKFAKASPDGAENEENYLRAFRFVEATKPADPEEEPTEDKR